MAASQGRVVGKLFLISSSFYHLSHTLHHHHGSSSTSRRLFTSSVVLHHGHNATTTTTTSSTGDDDDVTGGRTGLPSSDHPIPNRNLTTDIPPPPPNPIPNRPLRGGAPPPPPHSSSSSFKQQQGQSQSQGNHKFRDHRTSNHNDVQPPLPLQSSVLRFLNKSLPPHDTNVAPSSSPSADLFNPPPISPNPHIPLENQDQIHTPSRKSNSDPPQDADQIFKKMKDTGLIPNAVAMLDGLCKDGLVQEAMKLFGLMREKGLVQV